ncbi:unnamed protein product [Lepeophtheirus salmonis]|uniref:(salmon louse) hypothetical protein n=1 Tax=Lepeophtheirus salmonis TaxID=72036 RepID=A0A7R8CNI9_LEPSM|nr:unnamed protein product [Lepeophtheirus salmonis]CAF2846435.1 unnamed protein product [Lepeophtheirus salmonis]
MQKRNEINNWKENKVFEEEENHGQITFSTRCVVTEKIVKDTPIIKSSLVARGFEEHDNEIRTDSPTCSKEGLRMEMMLMNSNGWIWNSMDIKTAFFARRSNTKSCLFETT